MPRIRPASNPISYHKHTKQYYVTRGGKRLYLGSDKDEALRKYPRLGVATARRTLHESTLGTRSLVGLTAKLTAFDLSTFSANCGRCQLWLHLPMPNPSLMSEYIQENIFISTASSQF